MPSCSNYYAITGSFRNHSSEAPGEGREISEKNHFSSLKRNSKIIYLSCGILILIFDVTGVF